MMGSIRRARQPTIRQQRKQADTVPLAMQQRAFIELNKLRNGPLALGALRIWERRWLIKQGYVERAVLMTMEGITKPILATTPKGKEWLDANPE